MKRPITRDEALRLFRYDAGSGILYRIAMPTRWKTIVAVPEHESGSIDAHGYRVVKVFGTAVKTHRIAWLITFGEWPADAIDHINQNRLDNRVSNLRVASRSMNAKNCKLRSSNTSGVSGVAWSRREKIWVSSARRNGRQVHLGRSRNLFDAVCFRKSAERAYKYYEQKESGG